jgi:hypothetical protein
MNFIKVYDYVINHNKYETSDFSFYLYGLLKMIKPNNFIELGTGYGTTSFLAAQAFKENNFGKVITIDDGSQWEEKTNYKNFINDKIKELNLKKFIEFKNIKLNLFKLNELNNLDFIDIIFNDINCDPTYFASILKLLILKTRKESYFLIDRGATYWPSYCAIELILNNLNKNKIPKFILDLPGDNNKLEKIINKFNFYVMYIKKNNMIDDITQDSFAVIKIQENNVEYK